MVDDRAKPTIEHLVAEYHQAVYRYAYRLAGSAADAEDLVQQAFLAAQQRLDQLRSPEGARGWLFAILRNCFLKSCQRQQPKPATVLGLNLDAIAVEAEDKEVVDSELLQETLGELPPDYRVVLVMFYFEDCSYKDIAEKLDLPMGTVMSRLARAKGHLRNRLLEREKESVSPGVDRKSD